MVFLKKRKWSSDCKGTLFDKRCSVCGLVNFLTALALIGICNIFILDESVFGKIIYNIVFIFCIAFLDEKYISKSVNYLVSKIICKKEK